jgi:hypothetical protein
LRDGGKREEAEWVVREGVGTGGGGGEMTQALYAHMNNKTIKKKKRKSICVDGLKSW